MQETVNAGAAGGITEDPSNDHDALLARLQKLEAENKAYREREEKQLEDHHAKAGVANESNSESKERFTIAVEEGRDANDMNPIFVGVNGRGYKITRGHAVEVPAEVIRVLDDAVETRMIPVIGPDGNPTGYNPRSARRFPYRNFGKCVDAEGKRLNVNVPEEFRQGA